MINQGAGRITGPDQKNIGVHKLQVVRKGGHIQVTVATRGKNTFPEFSSDIE